MIMVVGQCMSRSFSNMKTKTVHYILNKQVCGADHLHRIHWPSGKGVYIHWQVRDVLMT